MKKAPVTRWILPLAAIAVACGGDEGTNPRELDYRPWETVSQIDDVVGSILASENVVLGIDAAGAALAQFSGSSAAAVSGLLRATAGLPSTMHALRPGRAARSTQLTLPPEIFERTLVWDPDRAEYVVDETRTDAPENGVRVVYYAMNPFTGEPALPILPLGHIDLIDRDVAEEERLGIRVVETAEQGDAVLVDYVVGFTGFAQSSTGDLTFTAVGTRTGLQFDLTQTFTWSQSENSSALEVDYQYAAEDGTVRVRLDASSAFDAQTWDRVDMIVDVGDGTEDVALEVGIGVSGALGGEIRLNGTAVVQISGFEHDPVFTYPDGGQLTVEEVDSLRDLWNLVSRVLELTNALLAPGLLLLLPG